MTTDIAVQVMEIVAEHNRAITNLPPTISPSDHLEDDLGFDSIDVTEIIMTCEEKFRIVISDSDADALDTVNSLIETVIRMLPNDR